MTQHQINTALTSTIEFSDEKRMYDESCKRILSQKEILAPIMKECVWEYKDIDIKEIAEKYIEGTPVIGSLQVFGGEKIRGLPTEAINENEGKVFYDIRYKTLVPNGDDFIELIINLEAQNKYHTGYSLVKRGEFYSCQRISSQYGTEFDAMDYDKIKKVYSIWICRNVPKYLENTITRYDMSETNLVGNVKEQKENYDIMSVVMIYLGSVKEEQSSNLLNLLNNVLSEEISAQEKLKILEEQHGIKRTKTIESEVQHMCNLSNGIEEKGIQKGREREKVEVAKKLIARNVSVEDITDLTGLPVEVIRNLTLNNEN